MVGTALAIVVLGALGCSHKSAQQKPSCGHGIDPTSPQCNLPQCSDGIDNDGDGLIDYPNDPGCFSPNQDSEEDDCPDGPNCPECGNHKDDDHNGLADYAGQDPGCFAASDTDEYTELPYACSSNDPAQHLPYNNEVSATLTPGGMSYLTGKCGGGMGPEQVFLLRIKHPKVMVATTDSPNTSADTVLYLRGDSCDPASELVCNDNISPTNHNSTITASLLPGTYYLVVDSTTNFGGGYDLQVHFFVGEGVPCQTGDDCGPGLVCRDPNGMGKVCSKHECSDGVDNDGDGLVDYPNDPGCATPDGDSETDDCPSALNNHTLGPNCPECGNKLDDNHNGKTDYPMETNCVAASSSTEWCLRHTVVQKLAAASTTGDTTGLPSDYENSTCTFATGVPDQTWRLDVPALDSLSLDLTTGGSSWFGEMALLNSTCTGTAIACSSSIAQTNVAAGTYFVVVDGDSATDYGPYTIAVAGTIKNGASCESPLAQSGALTCHVGYACKGTAGSRTCQHAQCSDGIDNNNDGKIDYPNDPGCSSPSDDTEATVCPGANCPACANGVDDNHNSRTDWPAEWGCVAASGMTENFCAADTNPNPTKIATKTTTASTTGKSFDAMLVPSCQSGAMSPELVYGLQLPVPVASLQIDTIGSSFDTVLALRDANCMMEVPGGCDDDGGGSLTSKIVLTNIGAGGYAVIVDGFGTANGNFTLNVHGTVATGTSCTSPLFSGGTAAVLSCPTGTTCTGTPATCH
jgi:hypothetical protein